MDSLSLSSSITRAFLLKNTVFISSGKWHFSREMEVFAVFETIIFKGGTNSKNAGREKVQETNLFSYEWPIGRVTETFQGKDGLVRVCSLRMYNGKILMRSVVITSNP
uniref:DUF5641 domain-containing protein n=1 Tax=Megaselia scalaris TaxID=36166 RepID=T1GDI6_MEGSC